MTSCSLYCLGTCSIDSISNILHTKIRRHFAQLAFSPLFSFLEAFAVSLFGPSSPRGPRDSLTLDNLFKHQASFCFVFPFLSLLKSNKHHPVPNENISDAALPCRGGRVQRSVARVKGSGAAGRPVKGELCEDAACVA